MGRPGKERRASIRYLHEMYLGTSSCTHRLRAVQLATYIPKSQFLPRCTRLPNYASGDFEGVKYFNLVEMVDKY